MTNWHALSTREIINQLDVSPQEGLSSALVKQRQEEYGLNEIPKHPPFSKAKLLLKQFQSPLVLVLLISASLAFLFSDVKDALVIFSAVFLDVSISFIQENKTAKIFTRLQNIVETKARVLRNGQKKTIRQQQLVPGDIILLQEGDKVPADVRLLETKQLQINESALTGEWKSNSKNSTPMEPGTPLTQRQNMAYSGTVVTGGKAKGIVVATGKQSQIGQIAHQVQAAEERLTPYQRKIKRFSRTIALIILILTGLIVLEGVIKGKNVLQVTEAAIASAVGAIPEGLPVAFTIVLAVGMKRILQQNGLIRQLSAAETLGSTSVILTDKTGTLTKGLMSIDQITPENNSKNILKTALVCCEADIENPADPLKKWRIHGQPVEKAIVQFAAQQFDPQVITQLTGRDNDLPFQSKNKFSASRYQNKLCFLGAPETLLEKSSLTDKEKKQFTATIQTFSSQGKRLLGVAEKEWNNNQKPNHQQKNLNFLGIIVFTDPLREDSKTAVTACQQAGLKPIIVTGDHPLTARHIARQLDIPAEEENIIEGKELQQLDDQALLKRLQDITVYARTAPQQKSRLVDAWQDSGAVVAMTGDGINDTLALKKADIGVAVESGTDLAKEVADLVLLDNSFAAIVKAVEEGRNILANMRKIITYLLSDSASELFLIATTTFLGLPLPISALQILWINLIEDGLPDVALALEPKSAHLLKQPPTPPDQPLLDQEVKTIIIAVSLLTFSLNLGLFWVLLNYTDYSLVYIRSFIFAAFTVDSLFYLFSCKSLEKNITTIKLFSNPWLLISFLLGWLLLLSALYWPLLQNFLHTTALSFNHWLVILPIALANLGLIELVKYHFIQKRKDE